MTLIGGETGDDQLTIATHISPLIILYDYCVCVCVHSYSKAISDRFDILPAAHCVLIVLPQHSLHRS